MPESPTTASRRPPQSRPPTPTSTLLAGRASLRCHPVSGRCDFGWLATTPTSQHARIGGSRRVLVAWRRTPAKPQMIARVVLQREARPGSRQVSSPSRTALAGEATHHPLQLRCDLSASVTLNGVPDYVELREPCPLLEGRRSANVK
jgi:hypothetical protein